MSWASWLAIGNLMLLVLLFVAGYIVIHRAMNRDIWRRKDTHHD